MLIAYFIYFYLLDEVLLLKIWYHGSLKSFLKFNQYFSDVLKATKIKKLKKYSSKLIIQLNLFQNIIIYEQDAVK